MSGNVTVGVARRCLGASVVGAPSLPVAPRAGRPSTAGGARSGGAIPSGWSVVGTGLLRWAPPHAAPLIQERLS